MALNTVSRCSRAARAPSMATLACLQSALSSLRVSTQTLPTITHMSRRNASHQAQGRANGAKDGAGKRLGAKKTGGEYVVTGNILFKQRGTHWFPGDNCFMGRDHTIHAGAPGYVRYYQDPLRHPHRKYIGIVFQKSQSLPQPPQAARRRQLGMLAYQIPQSQAQPSETELLNELMSSSPIKLPSDAPKSFRRDATSISLRPTTNNPQGLKLTLRPGYQYRQSNHEIGRSGERKEAAAQAKGKTTRAYAEFKPGDRFAAWRKRGVRVARNAERRSVGRGGKGGKVKN